MSASPLEIVEPLAHALGMTGGIGTRGQIVDGMYNGVLEGPFCYGEGKVEAIRELARWEGLDLAQCYAYSDSASDLPMLQAVGHPVAVNPDGRLERHARRNGWPIVHFSQRTKLVIRRTPQAGGATDRHRRRRVHRRRPGRRPVTVADSSPGCRPAGAFRSSGSERELAALRHQRSRESHISPSSSSNPPWMKRLR